MQASVYTRQWTAESFEATGFEIASTFRWVSHWTAVRHKINKSACSVSHLNAQVLLNLLKSEGRSDFNNVISSSQQGLNTTPRLFLCRSTPQSQHAQVISGLIIGRISEAIIAAMPLVSLITQDRWVILFDGEVTEPPLNTSPCVIRRWLRNPWSVKSLWWWEEMLLLLMFRRYCKETQLSGKVSHFSKRFRDATTKGKLFKRITFPSTCVTKRVLSTGASSRFMLVGY